jgi:hypothetical protein
MAACLLAAVFASNGLAETVPATSNIWGAGHVVPPGPAGGGAGTLPTMIELPCGVDRTLRFTAVTGQIDYGGCCVPNGPDGVPFAPCEILPWGGISGMLIDQGRFLTGVFLDDSEPVDPAPGSLDFTGSIDFASVGPDLGQTFFVGDGLTGTGAGSLQEFLVPDGATRLFLGVYDFYQCLGLPGGYGDNSGQFELSWSIEAPCIGDVNDDQAVSVTDLLIVLADWGACGAECPADTDCNGSVDVTDLLAVLGNWGPCA